MKLELRNNLKRENFFTIQLFMDGKDITNEVTSLKITKNSVEALVVEIAFLCETEVEIDNLEEISQIASGNLQVHRYIERGKKPQKSKRKRLWRRLTRSIIPHRTKSRRNKN